MGLTEAEVTTEQATMDQMEVTMAPMEAIMAQTEATKVQTEATKALTETTKDQAEVTTETLISVLPSTSVPKVMETVNRTKTVSQAYFVERITARVSLAESRLQELPGREKTTAAPTTRSTAILRT